MLWLVVKNPPPEMPAAALQQSHSTLRYNASLHATNAHGCCARLCPAGKSTAGAKVSNVLCINGQGGMVSQ